MGNLRVKGWPVAVDLLGGVRESARLRNSEEVFALWFLTFSATGPVQCKQETGKGEGGGQAGGHCKGGSVSIWTWGAG